MTGKKWSTAVLLACQKIIGGLSKSMHCSFITWKNEYVWLSDASISLTNQSDRIGFPDVSFNGFRDRESGGQKSKSSGHGSEYRKQAFDEMLQILLLEPRESSSLAAALDGICTRFPWLDPWWGWRSFRGTVADHQSLGRFPRNTTVANTRGGVPASPSVAAELVRGYAQLWYPSSREVWCRGHPGTRPHASTTSSGYLFWYEFYPIN